MFGKRPVWSAVLIATALIATLSKATGSQAAPERSAADNPCPISKIKPVGTRYKRGVNCRAVEIDGYPRTFIVYVPTNLNFDPNQQSPLVFMFHGTGGTGAKFLNISGWKEIAEQEGLVAVFPTGLKYLLLDSGNHKTKFNTFDLADEVDLNDKPPGYPASAPWPADDLGFVDAILDDAHSEGNIDPNRVFVSGFSNGGQFCARLAVERSDVFAGAACSAGSLLDDYSDQVVQPIPVALSFGNLDDRYIDPVNETEGTNITEIPMTYDEFVSHPVLKFVLDSNADSFGLSRTPTTVVERPRQMVLTFEDEADPQDTAERCSTFTLWKNVTHEYPNSVNNPFHFYAARIFWRFFERTWDGC
jgi:polyhydroxybutyrate depolymerase